MKKLLLTVVSILAATSLISTACNAGFLSGGVAGYTMAMNRHTANVLLDDLSRCAVMIATQGDGRKAIAKETCYQDKLLDSQKPDCADLVDVNGEREENGDTLACIEFSAGTRNVLTDLLASRTNAKGGENAVYCLSVDNNAWGSGATRKAALRNAKR